jgi:hypothetical protein
VVSQKREINTKFVAILEKTVTLVLSLLFGGIALSLSAGRTIGFAWEIGNGQVFLFCYDFSAYSYSVWAGSTFLGREFNESRFIGLGNSHGNLGQRRHEYCLDDRRHEWDGGHGRLG